jgi:hypothetical protein
MTRAPWLIFWDADDVMADGYLAATQRAISAAPPDLGIIYPDIRYCDEYLEPQAFWSMPPWDYWALRAENFITAQSTWRRVALEIVGGWKDRAGAHEDFELALEVTALGWKAAKLEGPPILARNHSDSRMSERRREAGILNDLWKARSLGIVSLLAGRDDTFARWAEFLLHAELPPKTALYVVDNSGRAEFMGKAFDACQRIADERRMLHLDFSCLGQAYRPADSEPYLERRRHQHVASLYAAVFPRVGEDLILSLEDDVEAPLDAVRRLGEEIGYRSRGAVGVVAASYSMPHEPGMVCAGLGDEAWQTLIRWEQVPGCLMDVGFVGGGCAVWANWALRGYPIHLRWDPILILGWDGVLCQALRRRGYRVVLHGGVRCRHHVHGQVTTP